MTEKQMRKHEEVLANMGLDFKFDRPAVDRKRLRDIPPLWKFRFEGKIWIKLTNEIIQNEKTGKRRLVDGSILCESTNGVLWVHHLHGMP